MSTVSFQQLLANSQSVSYEFPVQANRIHAVSQAPFSYDPKVIEHMAASTRLITTEEVVQLAEDFLVFHRKHGSAIEKKLYANMTLGQFFDKLIRNRPLMFMTTTDQYMLRDGTTGSGGFESIGTNEEKAPLVLASYNSYKEMEIAALMGISSPTYFINEGARNNEGIPALPGSFQERGIHIGLVGARFEKEGLMEWKYMVVSPGQNTRENGYGKAEDTFVHLTQRKELVIWAKFYGQGKEGDFYFPSYKEAQIGSIEAFIPFISDRGESCLLNVAVYKQRMYMTVKSLLLEANDRASVENEKSEGKMVRAYVVIVGFGIGVWALPGIKDQQAALIVEAVADVFHNNFLPHVSDICFSWFPSSCTNCNGAEDGEMFSTNMNNVTVHFNKDNPVKKLEGQHENKLLVASYAWDGNSFIGNEYWQGSLSASGDPAAVSCSLISELQNPGVNPSVKGENVWVAHHGSNSSY